MVRSGVMGKTGNQNCFHHVHDIKASVKSRDVSVGGERKLGSGKFQMVTPWHGVSDGFRGSISSIVFFKSIDFHYGLTITNVDVF